MMIKYVIKKNRWHKIYRTTAMTRNEFRALKIVQDLVKKKRYPVRYVEDDHKITITAA